MKLFNISTFKNYTIFFWLVFISIIAIFFSSVYNSSKSEKSKLLKSSLDNIYFKKTLKEITNNLNPRFSTLVYISKAGDTYQSIINGLKLNKSEKKNNIKPCFKIKILKNFNN